MDVQLYPFLTQAVDGGQWLTLTSGRFAPEKTAPNGW
jgi:hypothetical protein